MTSRPSTAAPILAVLAIVLATLGAYVGGYFWLGEYESFQSPGRAPSIVRTYRFAWQKMLFRSAGRVEGFLRVCSVTVRHSGDPYRVKGGVI